MMKVSIQIDFPFKLLTAIIFSPLPYNLDPLDKQLPVIVCGKTVGGFTHNTALNFYIYWRIRFFRQLIVCLPQALANGFIGLNPIHLICIARLKGTYFVTEYVMAAKIPRFRFCLGASNTHKSKGKDQEGQTGFLFGAN